MTPAARPTDQPANAAPHRIAAVVLAGGASRRFGSDKLLAPVEGVPLLQRAVADLPAEWQLIIVGPPRPVSRSAWFVREDPPGGGPAAGLVAGVRAALTSEATVMAILPGDAPHGGAAAVILVDHLLGSADPVVAVVATDNLGVDQPLQLALRGPALERIRARHDADGLSARRLLDDLAAAGEVVRLELPPALTADVDRPEDLTGQDGQDRLNPDRT